MESTQQAWWRGERGEWYVAVQVILIALVFFGPRTLPGWPAWPSTIEYISQYAGVFLMVAGVCLLFAGLFRLGANLTPLPYPREKATLIQSGPYGIVRHPMYSGGIILAYGWALAVNGWLTLIYATLLLIFAEIKARREERWLIERFPEYPDYQRRVRMLIPFIH
jgi:protein-S-isoprenylcysteine O-methyltransferase Ste14